MHLFLSVWIQLIQLFRALMHSNYTGMYGNTQLWDCVQYRKIDRLWYDRHIARELSQYDISDEQEQSASLLKECILLRDSVLTLPEIFTVTDIEHIISEVCSVS